MTDAVEVNRKASIEGMHRIGNPTNIAMIRLSHGFHVLIVSKETFPQRTTRSAAWSNKMMK